MSGWIAGQGLHQGRPARVAFARVDGPSRIDVGGRSFTLDRWTPMASERSTTIACEGVVLGTVEHLFAALGALGAWQGLAIHVEGPEIPLADGGARAFVDAIAALGLPRMPPSWVIRRELVVDLDGSRYAFAPGERDGVVVEVSVDFGDARLGRDARWDGDAADFRDRIAPARTFGFEHEVASLAARGLASHVAPESVVVIGEERVLSAGPPFAFDEPARHKLLDLVGDLAVHGGPPRGILRAEKPGHAKSHEAMRRAIDSGAVTRV